MKVVLKPGEKVEVTFDGTDGEIEVAFSQRAISVRADAPDSDGRDGLIYEERFDLGDTADVKVTCVGVDSKGRPAFSGLPIAVNVVMSRRPHATTIEAHPLNCPKNRGGHREKCQAGGECIYSFDYPYVTENIPGWKPPVELAPDFSAWSRTRA